MDLTEIGIKDTYLEDLDITVKNYLTYPEIQIIADSVQNFDTWVERQANIDMLVLANATDITEKELQDIGHEVLVTSGVVDAVFEQVKNVDKIYKAIEYKESFHKFLNDVNKYWPKYSKQIEDVVKSVQKR